MISDIHGNLHALKGVLEKARRYDSVVVLGDLFGMTDSIEVLDVVKELNPEAIIAGDADKALMYPPIFKRLPLTVRASLRPLFEKRSEAPIRRTLSKIVRLPSRMRVEIDGSPMLIAHATPRHPLHGYLTPRQPMAKIVKELSIVNHTPPDEINYIIIGHSHEAFSLETRKLGVKIFNPGSIGLPSDGDPRASYGVLDTDKDTFEIHRVKYDVKSVLKEIRNSLKIDEYNIVAESLLTGYTKLD